MLKCRIALFLIAIVLGSSALLLVACAPTTPSLVQTYAGPARPAEEVALLEEELEWNRGFPSLTLHKTTVIEIDGQATHANWPDKLEVLAGAHKVRFQYDRVREHGGGGGYLGLFSTVLSRDHSTRTDHPELEFEARAGGHYAAFGFTDSVDSQLYIWLIDVDTCTLIAGEPPPLEALPCKKIRYLEHTTVRQYSQPSP